MSRPPPWCGAANTCHAKGRGLSVAPRVGTICPASSPSGGLRRSPICVRRERPPLRLVRCRMTSLLADYLPLVIFIGVALVIGLALLLAPFIVAYQNPDPEKLSAYECGFNAFDDARMKFDVRFYLVVDPVHHLRPRGRLPVPLGDHLRRARLVRLLVDDDLPRRPHRRLRLRVEEGSARMGLIADRIGSSRGTLVAPAPRGSSTRYRQAGRSDRSVLSRDQRRARRQGLPRHRRPTTSSPGRAPAR